MKSLETCCNTLTLTVPNSEISEMRRFPSVPAVKCITLISFATQIWSQLILLTVPKKPFMLQCSKNRITYVSTFSTQTLVSTSLDMANVGEQLQNSIEPIIRDFIDSMELGVPRCVVTSERKSNSCLVLVRLGKGLNFKHSFFKAGFSISTFDDVQYLKKFLDTIYDHWRLYHPSNEDTTETYSDTADE